MLIKDVQIIPIKAKDGLIAFGSLTYGGVYISSIGIHKKLNGAGYRLTYPTKTIGDKVLNIFHPVDKETSREIEEAIINKIEKLFPY